MCFFIKPFQVIIMEMSIWLFIYDLKSFNTEEETFLQDFLLIRFRITRNVYSVVSVL